MGMTIDLAIEELESTKDYPASDPASDEALDFAIDIMHKYQQLQADYEQRLKADMVAMLEELDFRLSNYQDTDLIRQDIQQKINDLKAESEVKHG